MTSIKTITAAILTLAFAIPAHADAYIDRVFRNTIAPGIEARKYNIVKNISTPLLELGESHTLTIKPESGTNVMLVAIGNIDSVVVDMFVRRVIDNRLVSHDILNDDMPLCQFTADGGEYIIVITMHETNAPATAQLTYATRK